MATYCPEDPISFDLSCPICFEDYDILSKQRAPKLLLCLHTFCYGCTKLLWQPDGTLECSLCRTVHSHVALGDLFDNPVILQHLRKKHEEQDLELARRLDMEMRRHTSVSDPEPPPPVIDFTYSRREEVEHVREQEKEKDRNLDRNFCDELGAMVTVPAAPEPLNLPRVPPLLPHEEDEEEEEEATDEEENLSNLSVGDDIHHNISDYEEPLEEDQEEEEEEVEPIDILDIFNSSREEADVVDVEEDNREDEEEEEDDPDDLSWLSPCLGDDRPREEDYPGLEDDLESPEEEEEEEEEEEDRWHSARDSIASPQWWDDDDDYSMDEHQADLSDWFTSY